MFFENAFVITDKYVGGVNLDTWPVRNILEELVFLRGYGAFEVMETKGRKTFHLDDHLRRLDGAMKSLALPVITKNEESFADFFKRVVKFEEIFPWKDERRSLVWVVVSGGRTEDGYDPASPGNMYVLVSKFPNLRFRKDKGLVLRVFEHEREFPRIKTPNYCFAEIMQYAMGDPPNRFDDILYMSKDGSVLEASKANFFIVKNRKLTTPRVNVLPGITRDIVIRLAEANKTSLVEDDITMGNVMRADEAFVTSTTKLVWPVREVFFKCGENCLQRKIFSKEAGPVTMKLRREFLDYRRFYYKK